MKYKQYSVVKILEINKGIKASDLSLGERLPKIGDQAVIVEVYEKPVLGYELECVNENGTTEWMLAFSSEEVALELISEHT